MADAEVEDEAAAALAEPVADFDALAAFVVVVAAAAVVEAAAAVVAEPPPMGAVEVPSISD